MKNLAIVDSFNMSQEDYVRDNYMREKILTNTLEPGRYLVTFDVDTRFTIQFMLHDGSGSDVLKKLTNSISSGAGHYRFIVELPTAGCIKVVTFGDRCVNFTMSNIEVKLPA